jgi:hypothetical protein
MMAGHVTSDFRISKRGSVKGTAQQIKALLHKVNELGEQAASAEKERTRLQRQVECLEEMIQRGGMWLATLPEMQRLGLGETVDSSASTTSLGPTSTSDEEMTDATGMQPGTGKEVPPEGTAASLIYSRDVSSDYMAGILRRCTPEYAQLRKDWTWQQWNTLYAEFCKSASFLLSQLGSPVADQRVGEQLEQAVFSVSLDICCLCMYYPEVMIQCNTRNCSTCMHEAAPTELWDHVARLLQLDREARQKLAAGYESYAKVQAAVAAERAPLLQQLDIYSDKTEASEAGSSAVLSELLDALEHNMKRSQQAGMTVAMLIWSTLNPKQMAVALVSSYPFWIAAVPCKY